MVISKYPIIFVTIKTTDISFLSVHRKMGKDILDIKDVCECNRCLGSRTLHPQASLINLESPNFEQDFVKFEFYAILLIEDSTDNCNCCGRRYYDFSNATMVFLTPGEVFRMNAENTLPDKGLLLAFHPDLLFHTALNNHIDNYTFFFYRKEEALHLSQREKAIVIRCFEAIGRELHHDIDSHSSTLISRLIELLLDYCSRFYERQFITREEKNKTLLKELNSLINDYIASGRMRQGTFPTPEYCSEPLNLSPAYFKDLLKFETGKTLEEHVQRKRLEAARRLLLEADNTPASVARQLGFPNVHKFSHIFKKITGTSPNAYRDSQN